MASKYDIVQDSRIKLMLTLLAALGGITAFLIYIERKKHRKMESDVLALDKNIKELQLQRLKNGQSISI